MDVETENQLPLSATENIPESAKKKSTTPSTDKSPLKTKNGQPTEEHGESKSPRSVLKSRNKPEEDQENLKPSKSKVTFKDSENKSDTSKKETGSAQKATLGEKENAPVPETTEEKSSKKKSST